MMKKFVPVYLRNFRKGLATNSSSTHSLIYRNEGDVFEDLNIFELDFYDRMDNTIAATRQAKIKYILACIFHNEDLVKIMASKFPEMKEYYPLIKEQMEGENSEYVFGSYCRGDLIFPDNIVASVEYLTKIIDDPDIIIVGGSDEEDFVDDTVEGHLQMAQPWGYYVGWSDHSPVSKNGNYWLAYGGYSSERDKYYTPGRVRFNTSDNEELIPEFPELIDLRITNKCEHACPQCFMGSNPQGGHANLGFISQLLSEIGDKHKVEFSIGGGNILLYPDLDKTFSRIKKRGHIINVTIKADDVDTIINNETYLKVFNDYVSGIGISVYTEEDVDKANRLYDLFNSDKSEYKRKYIVIHLIPEYLGLKKTHAIIEKVKNDRTRYVQILFLGYKTLGRGTNCEYKTFNDKELDELMSDNPYINIDTTFAQRYADYIKKNFSHKYSITWNEGEFSMYVDGVEEKAYKSSYHLGKPYTLNADWKKKHYSVKEAFAEIRKDGGFKTYQEIEEHYWDT